MAFRAGRIYMILYFFYLLDFTVNYSRYGITYHKPQVKLAGGVDMIKMFLI
jgi:hypothetical protein